MVKYGVILIIFKDIVNRKLNISHAGVCSWDHNILHMQNHTGSKEAELHGTTSATHMWYLKRSSNCGHEEMFNCLVIDESVILKHEKRVEYVKCNISNISILEERKVEK